MKRFLFWFSSTIFPPVAAVSLVLWATHIEPPIEMQGMYFVGSYVENKPGTIFSIRQIGVKNRDCPTVVKEELVDSAGAVHMLPVRIGVSYNIGPFDTVIERKIPNDAPFPDGITVLRTVGVYDPDYLALCFKSYTIARPDVRFWVGSSPPPWTQTRR